MRDSTKAKPKILPDARYFQAAPEIAEEAAGWLRYLSGERRASYHTIDGYARDLANFLSFLTEHLGARPDSAALLALQPADMRSYLAKRRADGLENRSLLRALAAIRNFLRQLEKKGLAKTDFFGAVHAPRPDIATAPVVGVN